MNLPELTEIDLAKAEGHEHPDLRAGSWYLAKWDGRFYVGTFDRVWFGWTFDCNYGASGNIQFDAPGWNSSRWEGLWRLDEALT